MMIDWAEAAVDLGFSTEEEMLRAFYEQQGWSISKIAKKLGRGSATVQARLEKYNIQRRKRGGPNFIKKRELNISKDELMKGKVHELAKKYNVSPATIMRNRRRVKREEAE